MRGGIIIREANVLPIAGSDSYTPRHLCHVNTGNKLHGPRLGTVISVSLNTNEAPGQ